MAVEKGEQNQRTEAVQAGDPGQAWHIAFQERQSF